MSNLNQHVKSDKVKWIVTGVVMLLMLVLIGGLIASVVTETNPKEWFEPPGEEQPDDETPLPDDGDGVIVDEDGEQLEPGKIYPMSNMLFATTAAEHDEQITIEATTGNAELLSDHYIEHFRHGMTVIQGYGAYSHKRVYICKTVVSSYEVHDVVMCLRQVDPAVIINTYRTNSFYGRFYQKPIDDM